MHWPAGLFGYFPCYTLGAGHVKFFYDKLLFLRKRHEKIVVELLERNFKLSFPLGGVGEHLRLGHLELWNDYEPTAEALALNRARIAERLAVMRSTKNSRQGENHARD